MDLHTCKGYTSGRSCNENPLTPTLLYVDSGKKILERSFRCQLWRQLTQITFSQTDIVKTPTMGRYVHLTMKTWSVSLVLCSPMTPTSHLLCFQHSSVGCRMVSARNRLWKLLPLVLSTTMVLTNFPLLLMLPTSPG